MHKYPLQSLLPPLALDSFNAAKTTITNVIMLFHYDPDPHSELSLLIDVSEVAVGVVL